MEIPSTGRAKITEQFNNVEILIPVKKNYLFILSPIVAVAFVWFTGFLKPFVSIFKDDSPFMWFWLAWMGLILLSSLRLWLWLVLGKELIQVGDSVLSITRNGDFASLSTTYNLEDALYFRAEEKNNQYNNSLWNNYRAGYKAAGTICFQYGNKTIRFGENLSQAEGNYILKVLRDKKLLTDKNFVLNTQF